MIEKDLAHLRFLQTRAMKRDRLDLNDLDFIITKHAEVINILNNRTEMIYLIKQSEEQR